MTPAESMKELIDAVLQINGCGSTLLSIGQGMPNTPLEDDNTFCPEIFMRTMAAEVLKQANLALSRIEEIQRALKDSTERGDGKKGGAS